MQLSRLLASAGGSRLRLHCAWWVGLVLVGVVVGGCDSNKQSDSVPQAPSVTDGADSVDTVESDSQHNGRSGPSDSAAGMVDAMPDTSISSTDAAGTSDLVDAGLSDSGGGAGAPDADVGHGDSGASAPEVKDAGEDDIHVIVQPPSTHQPCACWPSGDDCDKFFNNVSWAYKEYPPCADNEVCTGDYQHSGWCQARCDHPKPGKTARFQCHPTEKCVTFEMFDWEEDTKALESLCVPK